MRAVVKVVVVGRRRVGLPGILTGNVDVEGRIGWVVVELEVKGVVVESDEDEEELGQNVAEREVVTVGEMDRAGADDAGTVTRRTDDGGAERSHTTDDAWSRSVRAEECCAEDGNEELVRLELVVGA